MSATDAKLAAARDEWVAAQALMYDAWVRHFCTSPIEQLFAAALFRHGFRQPTAPELIRRRLYKGGCIDPEFIFPVLFHTTNDDVILVAQHRIKIGGKNCRLDFMTQCPGGRIAIELDGHDFHERTKEQARHDKSRDRSLVEDGWVVLRFTGSEVWRDADDCVDQVMRIAEKHLVAVKPSSSGKAVPK